MKASVEFLGPKPSKFVCQLCGGTKLYERMWVGVNSGEVGHSCDDGSYFCEDCEDHVQITEIVE